MKPNVNQVVTVSTATCPGCLQDGRVFPHNCRRAGGRASVAQGQSSGFVVSSPRYRSIVSQIVWRSPPTAETTIDVVGCNRAWSDVDVRANVEKERRADLAGQCLGWGCLNDGCGQE